jgi:hypothetical protein
MTRHDSRLAMQRRWCLRFGHRWTRSRNGKRVCSECGQGGQGAH